MTTMIVVNLPVADLPRSMAFSGAFGFTNNPWFSDETAARHGGMADINPVQDHDFMYGRDLAEPDGHIWGPFWMDPEAMSESA
jgi:predicted lactoylglutathione lyase